MKRLISIAVIVAMLVIMMIPPMTDSYVAASYIYSNAFFSYYEGDLSIWGWVYAYEQPHREVLLLVHIQTTSIDRIFPAAELYSAPYPDPYEPNRNVLGKYWYEQGILGFPGRFYSVTLREDADNRAVFGRALFGVMAGYAGAYAIVLDIDFTDGVAPDIDVNSGLSTQLYNQIIHGLEGSNPFGFY